MPGTPSQTRLAWNENSAKLDGLGVLRHALEEIDVSNKDSKADRMKECRNIEAIFR